MRITLELDDAELRKKLRRLGARAPRALAEAINKVAFEVLDAEEAHVRSVFRGSQPRGFARGFRFDAAREATLEATIVPRSERLERIFFEHAVGAEIEATPGPGGGRLELGEQLAIPVGVRRGASGRVPRRQAPGALLAEGKAFVAGQAVLERRKRGGLRVLYALARRARLEARFRFIEVVERTARQEFGAKVRRAMEKLGGGSS